MRYVIHDNEAGNFCEWSYDNPPNEAEIKEHFKTISDYEDLGGDEPIPLEAFSLEFIQDLWNVRIIPVPEYIKELEADLNDLGSNYMAVMYQNITDQLTTMRGALNE
jgi:hypothetical protein